MCDDAGRFGKGRGCGGVARVRRCPQNPYRIGGTLPRRLAYQAPRVGAGRRVGGVRPDEGTRHCRPLRSCAADPGDEAERDGRERPADHAVVVGGRAAAKPRTPEPGTIDHDGPLATMRVGLPLAFPRHHPGPAADSLPARPVALPRRRPRAPSSRPLASIHSRCSKPRFVPIGQATTGVHNSVSIRQTASGSRRPLRYSIVSAPARYQRDLLGATPISEN